MENIMQLSSRPTVYISTESKDHISLYFSAISDALNISRDYRNLLAQVENGAERVHEPIPKIDLTLRKEAFGEHYFPQLREMI